MCGNQMSDSFQIRDTLPYREIKLRRGIIIHSQYLYSDRLCSLVVRVLAYRYGGPGSIPGTTRKKKGVRLERGPLSLMSTTEELLDRKVAALV
jgi:hypothetical protein